MTAQIIQFPEAPEDKALALANSRLSDMVSRPGLVKEVRARYLMRLRDILQRVPNVVSVVSASFPATDAFSFLEQEGRWMAVAGTEDVYKDAVMYVLAELDGLRLGGDQAYVVDVSTGEIVAPLTKEMVFVPPPYLDEDGIERAAKPVLNPEVAQALIMKAVAENEAAEVRDKASHPVRGLAYRHLTEPDKIVELATSSLVGSGLRLDEGLDEDVRELEFGREAEGSDLQSTNPFYHRLWSYSQSLASRVMREAGTGGTFWIGPVRLERDGDHRWYSVLVKTRRSGS
jgi:hypothetical protein